MVCCCFLQNLLSCRHHHLSKISRTWICCCCWLWWTIVSRLFLSSCSCLFSCFLFLGWWFRLDFSCSNQTEDVGGCLWVDRQPPGCYLLHYNYYDSSLYQWCLMFEAVVSRSQAGSFWQPVRKRSDSMVEWVLKERENSPQSSSRIRYYWQWSRSS